MSGKKSISSYKIELYISACIGNSANEYGTLSLYEAINNYNETVDKTILKSKIVISKITAHSGQEWLITLIRLPGTPRKQDLFLYMQGLAKYLAIRFSLSTSTIFTQNTTYEYSY